MKLKKSLLCQKVINSKGENGYKWSADASERRQERNLVTHLPGVEAAAENITISLDALNLLLGDEILNLVGLHTNEEINRSYSTLESHHKTNDIFEIKAVIGLLYLCGVQKTSKLSMKDLLSNKLGTVSRATIPVQNFNIVFDIR